MIYKNHTIKIICLPWGGVEACESLSFSGLKGIHKFFKLETNLSSSYGKCISAKAIAITTRTDSRDCTAETVPLPTYGMLCSGLSPSASTCTEIHQACLLPWKTA